MDKKLTYWLASIIGVVVLATGMTYGMLQFAEVPLESGDHVFAEVNKEDTLSNEAEVKGSNAQLHITVTSTEEEVISAMHSMTHQKVKACEGKEQPLCPKRMQRK